MAERQLPQTSNTIILAVSGGADSLGLVALTKSWREKLASDPSKADVPSIIAMIVDHGLRPCSAAEAKQVENMLQSAGIETRRVRITEPPPQRGLSEWARQKRYDLLVDETMKHKAVLMTAHHADDQLETVEMRLARGSGMRGLAAIQAETGYLGVRLIRPCLSFTKSELAVAANLSGFNAVFDPTNADQRYQRPRLRADRALRGKAGVKDQQLMRLCQLSSRMITQVDRTVEASSPGLFTLHPLGFALMAKKVLKQKSFFMIASHILRHMAVKPYPPSDEALANLSDQLISNRNATLGGCEWRWDTQNSNQIIICREAEVPIKHKQLPSGQGVFDNRWRINFPQAVRVEAIGEKRFARMKPHLLNISGWPRHMARVFWSLPVLIDTVGKNIDDLNRLILDDGAIFPHLINIGTKKDANYRIDFSLSSFMGSGGRQDLQTGLQ